MGTDSNEMSAGIDMAVEAATASLRQSIRDAYQQGYDAALSDLKDRIMAVFGTHIITAHAEAVSTSHAALRRRRPAKTRARRGVAAAAVEAVLAEEAGLAIKEIHQQALKLGHKLSVESVGSELRRFEGTKYRRDERRNWFPVNSTETDAHSGSGPDVRRDQPEAAQASG